MMVDNRQYNKEIKLIFLHIPKTGGTFIEDNLQKIILKIFNSNRILSGHYSLNMYEKDKFKNYIRCSERSI
jgi:hypothetical protein